MVLSLGECCSGDWLIPERVNWGWYRVSQALFPGCWEWSAGSGLQELSAESGLPALPAESALWWCSEWFPESRFPARELQYQESVRPFLAARFLAESYPAWFVPEWSVRKSIQWSVPQSSLSLLLLFRRLPIRFAKPPSEPEQRFDSARWV